jgi:hypothetical protein
MKFLNVEFYLRKFVGVLIALNLCFAIIISNSFVQ